MFSHISVSTEIKSKCIPPSPHNIKISSSLAQLSSQLNLQSKILSPDCAYQQLGIGAKRNWDFFFFFARTSDNGRRQMLYKAETNVVGDVSRVVSSEMSPFERAVELLTSLFPLFVVIGAALGIYKSSTITWLQIDLFTMCLGFLMLSMGLTLTFDDFRRCLRNPWTVCVGFLAQYLVKPLLGFVIALSLKLSAPLAIGLILVSCWI